MGPFSALGAIFKAMFTFFGTVDKAALALDAVADVAVNAAQHYRNTEMLRNATDIQRVERELAALLAAPTAP